MVWRRTRHRTRQGGTMSSMIFRSILWSCTVAALVSCGDDGNVDPPVPVAIAGISGNDQQGTPGMALPLPLSVQVTDAAGNPASGTAVTWSVLSGGGSISPASSTTNA